MPLTWMLLGDGHFWLPQIKTACHTISNHEDIQNSNSHTFPDNTVQVKYELKNPHI